MDLEKILQAASPLASAAVAGVAILASARQAKANLALSEHQRRIDEAKLKSEMWDKRYDAWAQLLMSTNERFTGAHRTRLADDSNASHEELADFGNAAEKMYFLFPTEVSDAVSEVHNRLTALHVASINEHSLDSTRAETDKARGDALEAIRSLRMLMKRYMEPSVVAPEPVKPKRRLRIAQLSQTRTAQPRSS